MKALFFKKLIELISEEIDEDELGGAFAVVDTHWKGYIALEDSLFDGKGLKPVKKKREQMDMICCRLNFSCVVKRGTHNYFLFFHKYCQKVSYI